MGAYFFVFLGGVVTGWCGCVIWVAFFMKVGPNEGDSDSPDSANRGLPLLHGVDNVERHPQACACHPDRRVVSLGSTTWYVGKDENDTASN